MGKIFFTSDPHFGHKNIIQFENRPFQSVEEMDKTLIENWNAKVGKDDEVYILGDFCFANKAYTLKILNQLNGKKFLIRGNHDHVVKDAEVASKFVWIKEYYELKHNKMTFVLFHYPIQVWSKKHYGAIHLYGHIHSDQENHHPMVAKLENAYNVGVDVNNLAPIELNELLVKMRYIG